MTLNQPMMAAMSNPTAWHDETMLTPSSSTSSTHNDPSYEFDSSSKYAVKGRVEDNADDDDDDEEVDDAETPFQQLMNRGNCLRQLRMLALADDLERQQHSTTTTTTIHPRNHRTTTSFYEEKKEEYEPSDIIYNKNNNNAEYVPFGVEEREKEVMQEDAIYTLCTTTTNETMLDYNSYLAHQRYYDDLKHVDINYIDYGHVRKKRNCDVGGDGDGGCASSTSTVARDRSDGENGGRLVVEQRKRLGKGGLCWDAAFILGEHVIHQAEEWNIGTTGMTTSSARTTLTGPLRGARVVELGAGTGLCGMMLAKAIQCHVEITDLPELYDLMNANVARNFTTGGGENIPTTSPDWDADHKSMGTISSRVLRWGNESDYQGAPYDCIIGADIVTNLYDPVALAQTIHALSGPNTRVYISGKARLDKPHEEFDVEMQRLFESVTKIRADSIHSQLKSPNVFIIVVEGKRSLQD